MPDDRASRTAASFPPRRRRSHCRRSDQQLAAPRREAGVVLYVFARTLSVPLTSLVCLSVCPSLHMFLSSQCVCFCHSVSLCFSLSSCLLLLYTLAFSLPADGDVRAESAVPRHQSRDLKTTRITHCEVNQKHWIVLGHSNLLVLHFL